MIRKIRFEMFVIKECIKDIRRMIKFTGSYRIILSYLNPYAKYDVGDRHEQTGNYYQYIRNFWKDTGYLQD